MEDDLNGCGTALGNLVHHYPTSLGPAGQLDILKLRQISAHLRAWLSLAITISEINTHKDKVLFSTYTPPTHPRAN